MSILKFRVNATKEQWLTALESGDYVQTSGTLTEPAWNSRHGDAENVFCCLGVVCEISANTIKDHNGYLPISSLSQEKISGYLGSARPKWMSKAQHDACAFANDALDWTFAQIAEWWRETDGAVKSNRHHPDYSFEKDTSIRTGARAQRGIA